MNQKRFERTRDNLVSKALADEDHLPFNVGYIDTTTKDGDIYESFVLGYPTVPNEKPAHPGTIVSLLNNHEMEKALYMASVVVLTQSPHLRDYARLFLLFTKTKTEIIVDSLDIAKNSSYH